MAGEGFALAREELIRTLTAYSGITTADGSSNKNTLIDSALIGKNDFLTGKSILIMSGDAQYETTGISVFSSTTGEITFGAALSARIVAGISFRVLNTLPESVHITSGAVQIEGYDYVSGEYRLVAVNESGQIEIKATVADIVTARVSGVVAVVSGEIHVMSGQVDVSILSGEAIKISGETIIAKVSGESLALASGTGPILAKISGETVSLPVSQVVKVSGETIIAKVSGETVSIAVPTAIVHFQQTIPDSATQLTSGAVKSAVVKALTANSGMIYMGDSDVSTANGFELDAGEAASADIDNTNRLYAIASVSGDKICALGVN